MEKYNLFVRVFVIIPVVIIMGFIWAVIGAFSTKSLGEVLKETGENLLKR